MIHRLSPARLDWAQWGMHNARILIRDIYASCTTIGTRRMDGAEREETHYSTSSWCHEAEKPLFHVGASLSVGDCGNRLPIMLASICTHVICRALMVSQYAAYLLEMPGTQKGVHTGDGNAHG